MDALNRELVALRDYVLEHGVDARLFQLPEPHDSDDDEARKKPAEMGPGHDAIEVTEIRGRKAIKAAAKLYAKTGRERDQDPLRSYRAAGIVSVAGYLGPLKKLVTRINRRKQALSAAVKTAAPTSEERLELFHGTSLQHVHLAQAYRKVVLLSPEIHRASFSWARGLNSVSSTNISELVDLLRRRGYDQWAGPLETQYSGSEKLVRVKPLAPIPVCNLVSDRGPRREVAVLPYLTIVEVEISRPLTSYDPKLERRARRSDSSIIEPPVATMGSVSWHRVREDSDRAIFQRAKEGSISARYAAKRLKVTARILKQRIQRATSGR